MRHETFSRSCMCWDICCFGWYHLSTRARVSHSLFAYRGDEFTITARHTHCVPPISNETNDNVAKIYLSRKKVRIDWAERRTLHPLNECMSVWMSEWCCVDGWLDDWMLVWIRFVLFASHFRFLQAANVNVVHNTVFHRRHHCYCCCGGGGGSQTVLNYVYTVERKQSLSFCDLSFVARNADKIITNFNR